MYERNMQSTVLLLHTVTTNDHKSRLAGERQQLRMVASLSPAWRKAGGFARITQIYVACSYRDISESKDDQQAESQIRHTCM